MTFNDESRLDWQDEWQYPKNPGMSYGWWKKSCTSWYGKYPIIYRVSYIQGGAGFLPSTVRKGLPLHSYIYSFRMGIGTWKILFDPGGVWILKMILGLLVFWMLAGWWVSNILLFSPRTLGKMNPFEPILTNIFQMGWNHQLVRELRLSRSYTPPGLVFKVNIIDRRHFFGFMDADLRSCLQRDGDARGNAFESLDQDVISSSLSRQKNCRFKIYQETPRSWREAVGCWCFCWKVSNYPALKRWLIHGLIAFGGLLWLRQQLAEAYHKNKPLCFNASSFQKTHPATWHDISDSASHTTLAFLATHFQPNTWH